MSENCRHLNTFYPRMERARQVYTHNVVAEIYTVAQLAVTEQYPGRHRTNPRARCELQQLGDRAIQKAERSSTGEAKDSLPTTNCKKCGLCVSATVHATTNIPNLVKKVDNAIKQQGRRWR